MLNNYLALAISIFISTAGQLFIKAGAMSNSSIHIIPILQPYIFSGLSCYFISALFYIYAVKQIPISIAFPCVSISYIAVSIIAHFIWKEPIGIQQGIGMFLIVSGVFLLVKV